MRWKLKLRISALKRCKNQWKRLNSWNFRSNLNGHTNITAKNIISLLRKRKRINNRHKALLYHPFVLFYPCTNIEINTDVVAVNKRVSSFVANCFNIVYFYVVFAVSFFLNIYDITKQSLVFRSFIRIYHMSYCEVENL